MTKQHKCGCCGFELFIPVTSDEELEELKRTKCPRCYNCDWVEYDDGETPGDVVLLLYDSVKTWRG